MQETAIRLQYPRLEPLADQPHEGLVGYTRTQHALEHVVVEMGEKALLQIETQRLHRVPGTDTRPVSEAHG